MSRPNVFPLIAPATVTSSVPESTTQAISRDSEGPASAPTILVELDACFVIPTALPAPPLVPTLAAIEGWHPPPPSPLPGRRAALSLVEPPTRHSRRPTVRVPEVRSQKLRIAERPSTPPTAPPPGGRAMRRVA